MSEEEFRSIVEAALGAPSADDVEAPRRPDFAYVAGWTHRDVLRFEKAFTPCVVRELIGDRDAWRATTETWENPDIRYALMDQRDRWRSLRVLLREIVADWFDRWWRRSGRSIIQRPKGGA